MERSEEKEQQQEENVDEVSLELDDHHTIARLPQANHVPNTGPLQRYRDRVEEGRKVE